MLKGIESSGGLIAILFGGVVLFALIAVAVEAWLPGHDVLLTFMIGLANNFAGALLLLIKSRSGATVDASGRSVEVNVDQNPKQ